MAATKGERTRERIVATAAELFNRRGYAAASMADLMEATGLEKGGIYRHFGSKDDLALAAFDHAVALQAARFQAYVEAERGAVARLAALGRAMASVVLDPVLPGGCPLLNTTVESDEGEEPVTRELRSRTRAAMRRLLAYARRIAEAGVATGELRADVDAAAEAEFLVATMEGGVLLSRLFDDRRHVRAAAARVERQARSLAR